MRLLGREPRRDKAWGRQGGPRRAKLPPAPGPGVQSWSAETCILLFCVPSPTFTFPTLWSSVPLFSPPSVLAPSYFPAPRPCPFLPPHPMPPPPYLPSYFPHLLSPGPFPRIKLEPQQISLGRLHSFPEDLHYSAFALLTSKHSFVPGRILLTPAREKDPKRILSIVNLTFIFFCHLPFFPFLLCRGLCAP